MVWRGFSPTNSRELKDYVDTEISYKDRYEDLLYKRGYYDHQAYANTFPY